MHGGVTHGVLVLRFDVLWFSNAHFFLSHDFAYKKQKKKRFNCQVRATWDVFVTIHFIEIVLV